MTTLPIPAPPLLSDAELHQLLMQYRRENWEGIQTPEWQARIVDALVRDDGTGILQQIAAFHPLPPDATVLDVGSGVGNFVVGCRRRGLRAFGVEPDRIGSGSNLTSVQIATRRLETQAFAVSVGENLPFRDRSFDLITMNQVVEHVSDQKAVLREAARVVKEGGAIYIACPNYLRFYEPHYKIFWLPLLPKSLGRLYLKLRRRRPVLLDQLIYTTNARLAKLIRELGPGYSLIDLHRESFVRKCAAASFSSSRARLVSVLARAPMFGGFVKWAALLFLRVTEGGCEMLVVRDFDAAGKP